MAFGQPVGEASALLGAPTQITNLVNGQVLVYNASLGVWQNQTVAGGGGVSSLNGLTGALSLAAGSGIGVTPSGTTITLANAGVLSLQGSTGALTLSAGGGISIAGLTITNAGVTSAVAGTGISVNAATGAVTFTNSGVTSAVAGTGITLSSGTGAVTITNAGATSVAAANGSVVVSPTTGAVTVKLGELNSGGTLDAVPFAVSGTAAGDILTNNGTDWVNFAAGTTNQVLMMTSTGGVFSWQTAIAYSFLATYFSGTVTTTTLYTAFGGPVTPASTVVANYFHQTMTITAVDLYVVTNSLSSSDTYTVTVYNATTSLGLAVSFAGGATGHESATGSLAVGSGAELYIKMVSSAGTGTLTATLTVTFTTNVT